MAKKTFREWRKEKGFTTKFVSGKLDIAAPTLTAKERGKYPFTKVQESILCELYGIKSEQVAR